MIFNGQWVGRVERSETIIIETISSFSFGKGGGAKPFFFFLFFFLIYIKLIKYKRIKKKEGINLVYKKYFNEAKVQAELYRRLTNLAIKVGIEYKIGRSRCDLIIIKDDKIKGVIEVKKKKRKYFNKHTSQYHKYSLLTIPTIYCLGFNNIEPTINYVIEHFLTDKVEKGIIVFNN